MKGSPRRLIAAHYRTYADARTGKLLRRDHVVFSGLPLVVFVACVVAGVELPAEASAGLLTVAGLLSAFLFGVMLQISERAMNWADAGPERGPDTSNHAIFLGEIAANAGYASLVSVVTAVAFVVAVATPKTAQVAVSAVGLSLAAHLALVLLLVITRVYALAEGRLVRARTSGTVSSLKKRSKTG